MGILSANPMGAIAGLLGDVLMPFDNAGLGFTPLYLAMIAFSCVNAVFSTLYFTVLESGPRRTPGKALMHLQVVGVLDPDPSIGNAFTRNIDRILFGALGGYLLGIVGANLFPALVMLVEYFGFSGRKADLRQKYLDVVAMTIVLFEDDEVEIGDIHIDGAPTVEDLLRAKKEKKSAVSRTPTSQGIGGKGFKQTAPMLGSSPRTISVAIPKEPVEKSDSRDRPAFGGSLTRGAREKPQEEAPASTKEGHDKERKGKGLLSGLFGGKSEREPEPEKVADMTSMELSEGIDRGDDADGVVLAFMMDFDIDEDRARKLYDAGYRLSSEFAEAIPEDLMMIEGINPTVARRIVAQANGAAT